MKLKFVSLVIILNLLLLPSMCFSFYDQLEFMDEDVSKYHENNLNGFLDQKEYFSWLVLYPKTREVKIGATYEWLDFRAGYHKGHGDTSLRCLLYIKRHLTEDKPFGKNTYYYTCTIDMYKGEYGLFERVISVTDEIFYHKMYSPKNDFKRCSNFFLMFDFQWGRAILCAQLDHFFDGIWPCGHKLYFQSNHMIVENELKLEGEN